MEKATNKVLYHISMDRTHHPFIGVLQFVTGVMFAAKYIREIKQAIISNIRHFLPALHENALLALIVYMIMICGYVLFPLGTGLLVYIPLRDFLMRRVITGTLHGVMTGEKSKFLTLTIGQKNVRVRSVETLCSVLTQEEVFGTKIKIYIGAFDRVISIEAQAFP